jgi:hypothetical protein
LTENELSVVGDFRSHIDRINEFKSKHNNKKKLIVLHLNFNSVSNKVFELDEVLEKCNPDCFLINESKLDSQKPNSWYINKKYNCLRLDREDEGGGGNLAFIRKGIVIKKVELTNFESIYFQLMIDGQLANFITAYKSPSKDNNEFLEKLENFLLLLNPYEPLFIFGDLNMDLKSSKGNDLAKFMARNELKNFVDVYTRIFRKYYKETKDYKTSKTLIDVAIHNQKKIIETAAIGCPFSDHHFVIAALDFHSPKLATFSNFGRSLSEKNLFLIGDHLKNSSHEFEIDSTNKDIDRIWQEYKLKITDILDLVSPVRLFKERPKEILPWEDEELCEKRRARDFYYFKFKDTNVHDDYLNYSRLRSECQSLVRLKMIDYFESKEIKDFKNSKLYYEFYSASVKIKSCKTEEFMPNTFIYESNEFSDSEEIGNLFNTFFTNISSTSLASDIDSDNFIDKTLSQLKKDKFITLQTENLKFYIRMKILLND